MVTTNNFELSFDVLLNKNSDEFSYDFDTLVLFVHVHMMKCGFFIKENNEISFQFSMPPRLKDGGFKNVYVRNEDEKLQIATSNSQDYLTIQIREMDTGKIALLRLKLSNYINSGKLFQNLTSDQRQQIVNALKSKLNSLSNDRPDQMKHEH